MAKIRDKELSQLWGASIYCPLHGKFETSLLSHLVCPVCDINGEYSHLLRRSRTKKRNREHKEYDDNGSLE